VTALVSRHAWILLCLGCASEIRPMPGRPGSELVLELGQALEIAYSPLWCKDEVWLRDCTHLLDSGLVAFQWDRWQRPQQVTRQWGPISPLHAIEVRDSLRQMFERRGGSRFGWPIASDHISHGGHTRTEQWCIDGAVASLVTSWQDRRPVEWIGLLVSLGPERDCSSTPAAGVLVSGEAPALPAGEADR
jgi:hypothetical protein